MTLGGARPKALLDIAGEQWVIKFDDGEPADTPLIEHASMLLAQKANIRVATTQAVRLIHGHAVIIKRFDRANGSRLHCLSACVALRAAAERFGYPELAQLLRRRGVVEDDQNVRDMHELFRRMVFNILIDNTDDHEKNHALVATDAQQYRLSPAYDLVPTVLYYPKDELALSLAGTRVFGEVSAATFLRLGASCEQPEAAVRGWVEEWWTNSRVWPSDAEGAGTGADGGGGAGAAGAAATAFSDHSGGRARAGVSSGKGRGAP